MTRGRIILRRGFAKLKYCWMERGRDIGTTQSAKRIRDMERTLTGRRHTHTKKMSVEERKKKKREKNKTKTTTTNNRKTKHKRTGKSFGEEGS